jgi:hypothetical protein
VARDRLAKRLICRQYFVRIVQEVFYFDVYFNVVACLKVCRLIRQALLYLLYLLIQVQVISKA